MPPRPSSPVLDTSGFLLQMREAIAEERFVSLVLSGGRGDEAPRQDVRPVEIAGEPRLQWSVRQGRQQHHENRTAADSLDRVETLLGSIYRNAILRTTGTETSARVTKQGRLQVSTRRHAAAPASLRHDQAPQYLLNAGTPYPFLHEIGVTTVDGQVRAAQQHKFRQINRYLEFVRDIVDELPGEGRLEVVDCGCGKSGLTFALQHYLSQTVGREVHLVGLDWNEPVLESCRLITRRLGLQGIEFRPGDIASYTPSSPVHLVVSLHACDTATDAALAQAIRWGAEVILAVPCCQHELSPQLASPPLEGLLRHGILRERLAADVTDALRAALLEVHGYRTQVLEFIELEHTPKNLLLRAVRRHTPLTAAILGERREAYAALKQLLGVSTFALERLLEESPPPQPEAEPPGPPQP